MILFGLCHNYLPQRDATMILKPHVLIIKKIISKKHKKIIKTLHAVHPYRLLVKH